MLAPVAPPKGRTRGGVVVASGMAAIYQRARPARFDEVVGQDHVTTLLVAAVRRGAVGHAYLFSGPRGVGKTTTARLLAMAVNCDSDAATPPCGACESCLAVQAAGHPDVIELDAASNNSVDDVRELREQVRLAPLRGGRRVWILDEAHMLSRAAANALLKTLEEPPPGLLFVLATTEPEKLPATVLSRCQHFRFRRLSDDEIRGKLERLLAADGTPADGAALDLLARAADGAMRDAESLLERLLASGEPLTLAAAEAALGLPPQERLAALAGALAAGDLASLLAGAAELYGDGFAPRTVAEQLGRTLRDALVARVRSESRRGGSPTVAPREGALEVAAQVADEDALIRALHVLDDAQERFVRRGDLYALEVTVIRAAAAIRAPKGAHEGLQPEAAEDVTGVLAQRVPVPVAAAPAPAGGGGAQATRASPAAAELAASGETPASGEPAASGEAHVAGEPSAGSLERFDPNAPAPRTSAAAQKHRKAGSTKLSWHTILARAGPQLKAFLLPAEASFDGGRLDVRYDTRHAFHFSQLQRREREFLELLDAAGGSHLRVTVEGPGGRLQRDRSGEAPAGSSAKKA